MTPDDLLSLRGIILIGLLASLILLYAYRKGFFTLCENWSQKSPVAWYDLLVGFAIYYGTIILTAPLLFKVLKIPVKSLIQALGYVNFAAFTIIPVLLYLYFIKFRQNSLPSLFKDKNSPSTPTNIGYGLIAYLLSLPLILFLSQILAIVVLQIFGTLGPEQNAVRVLKMMIGQPSLLIPMLTVIILVGPLVEEFLFRVLLQSFLRNHLGTKAAILLSSLGFALLHYSKEQEVGNFILLPMLFILGLFLGFIYERQRSFFSCYSLHVIFNLATTSWLLTSSN